MGSKESPRSHKLDTALCSSHIPRRTFKQSCNINKEIVSTSKIKGVTHALRAWPDSCSSASIAEAHYNNSCKQFRETHHTFLSNMYCLWLQQSTRVNVWSQFAHSCSCDDALVTSALCLDDLCCSKLTLDEVDVSWLPGWADSPSIPVVPSDFSVLASCVGLSSNSVSRQTLLLLSP